ncbi:Rz1-like lysis system protein LysC [Pseudomonas sp. CC6-YY-74]|uniref:Rz1-like lysis system protein LysC n=1 Tax=Pseudomonas sp. CC6-YY-74 TaxID=1930532 RepID=UPI001C475D28
MTKPSLITWLSLCLLLSACSTPAPKPPTPAPTLHHQPCTLVPCYLPARPQLLINDHWRQALDESEGALLSCAAQVLKCIERQRVQAPP